MERNRYEFYVQVRHTGTPTLPEVSLHCFSFTHCTKQKLRHYRQASKLSIQHKHLSTGTHNWFFFSGFYVLYIFRLQVTNGFLLTTLFCKWGGLVQQLHTATDCQWCEEGSSLQRPGVCAATWRVLLRAEGRNGKEKSRGGKSRGGKVSACTILKSHLMPCGLNDSCWSGLGILPK